MSLSDSYSGPSEGSDLRNGRDPGPSNRYVGPLRSPTPPSPRTPRESLDQGSLTARRRPHGKDRDRRSSTREMLKILLNEESGSKQSRTLLRSAIARLEAETQRAQEAERRALELAANFKAMNNIRLTTQQELSRVSEELRLYKVQYDNAQREIIRGQDVLKELEAQRDDAEAVAARARTETRKLREEKLVYQAHENGHYEGYREGLRRGMEQARYERLLEEGVDDRAAPQRQPLAAPLEIAVTNLPSLNENGVDIQSPIPQHPIPTFDDSVRPAEHVSRFHEHGIGSTPTPSHVNLPPPSQPWPEGEETQVYQRPPSTASAHSHVHPHMPVPPDGWIPALDSDDVIRLPPAHELNDNPALTPRSPSQPIPLPIPPPGQVRDRRRRAPTPVEKGGYPQSLESGNSVPSTTISEFDIVSEPPARLSTIREASMELSPEMPEAITFPLGPADRDMERGHEEPERVRTPRSYSSKSRVADEFRYENPAATEQWQHDGAEERRDAFANSAQMEYRNRMQQPPLAVPPPREVTNTAHQFVAPPAFQPESQSTPVSESNAFTVPPPRMNRSADTLAASSSRPMSASPSRRPLSSRPQSRQSRASQDDSRDISINIVSPSVSASTSRRSSTDENINVNMLSPRNAPLSMAPQPLARSLEALVPTVPNSPSLGQQPSLGILPGSLPGTVPVSGFPAGFVPLGPPTPAATANPLPVMPPSYPPMSTNLYRPSAQGARPPGSLEGSISSDSTPPSVIPPPASPHRRSYSENQSMHSKPPSIIVRPPSSTGSGSSRGPRTLFHPSAVNSETEQQPVVIPPPATPRSQSAASGHYRSMSLNAGNTPGFSSRPLSTAPAPRLRRVPSDASEGSVVSGTSSQAKRYSHYQPNEYLDAAYLASTEDLTANVLSPNTQANTRANAAVGGPMVPSVGRPKSAGSSALSYASMRR